MNLPFPLRSNPSPIIFMGEPRLVNCYPEKIGEEKRSPVAFLVPPGMDGFAEPSDIPSRGMIDLPELEVFYSLHGSTLYTVDSEGNATAVPGVIPGSNPVIMERGPERFRSSEVSITTASPAVVTWINHRLEPGDAFQFTTDGELPDGIEPNTTYYVQTPGLTANQFTFSAGETPVTTTWDAANKSAEITLSGSDLVATVGTGAEGVSVRAELSRTTGKYYAEFTVTTAAVASTWGIGVCNAAYVPGGPVYLGGDNNGIGNYAGGVFINAGAVAVESFAAADVICMAVDLDNATIWWRVNGGDWNDDGSADPATNIGGISIFALGGGAIFPAWEGEGNGDAVTANFGATSYAEAVPSGFGDWEEGTAINTTAGGTGTHSVTLTTPSYQVAIVSDQATFVVEDNVIYFVDGEETFVAVTFLDNRFIYTAASGRSYPSALNDARTVPALGYFTAEARPDGMVRDFADRGELWRFGTRTTEIYTGSGDPDEPFTPLGGSFIDKGCASKMSVVSFDNAPHWLGHDGIVYRGSGYEALRVSDHAVERAIAAVEDKTTINGFVWTWRGHSFYVLTCDQWTWVLDAATGVWHERKSYERDDWRAWPHIFTGRYNIVGDKASGRLSILSEDEYTELDDAPIIAELTLPDIPGKMIHRRLEIDLATGEGNIPGDNAWVMVDWSDDGGHTFSNERIVTIGAEGAWDTRVRFSRLGMARTIRGRRYRIRQSSAVRRGFLLGDIEAVAA